MAHLDSIKRLLDKTHEFPGFPQYINGSKRLLKDPVLVAIDCEMVETENDKHALARVSIVDESGRVLLDILIRPPGLVVDYRTHLTGLTRNHLQEGKSLNQALDAVSSALASAGCRADNMVLVGHAIDRDLRALGISCDLVIDTSCIFSYSDRPRVKLTLQELARRLLDAEVKTNPHDSIDNARTTMKLVQHELLHGPIPPLQTAPNNSQYVILFIGNLPWSITTEELREKFSTWGEILDNNTKVCADRTGRSKGYAFVTFQGNNAQSNANKAVQEMSMVRWKDRVIRIDLAKSQTIEATNQNEYKNSSSVISNQNTTGICSSPSARNIITSPTASTRVISPRA